VSVVLVINSGSSSIKYRLLEMDGEHTLAAGLIERIGASGSVLTHRGESRDSDQEQSIERDVPDHSAGFALMLEAFGRFGPSLESKPPVAVGHRVVHGGQRFFEPILVTEAVKRDIEELGELAPLHNAANLQGIVAAENAFPDVPHVVVFDTAFHRTLPPEAYSYAIDATIAARHRIRRYGFHGTSHKYVSEAAAAFLRRPLEQLRQIVFHLGNGASACAVSGGRSVETSMGLTPLEGLVMGTRSGDLDPAIVFHLHRRLGAGFDELDELLNRRSGLLGLSGHADMRDVQSAADAGHAASALALQVYAHRIRSYLGAYLVHLGGLDVVCFTAGVGEHAARVRELAMAGLEHLGIVLDRERNALPGGGVRRISAEGSAVEVLVVPTDEEVEIARQTLGLVAPA